MAFLNLYTLYIHTKENVIQYGLENREWDSIEKDIDFLTKTGRYTHSQLEARLKLFSRD